MAQKKGRLAEAINKFKDITFAGCIGSAQRKTSMRAREEMVGDNIEDVFNATGADTNSEAFAEIMSAMKGIFALSNKMAT